MYNLDIVVIFWLNIPKKLGKKKKLVKMSSWLMNIKRVLNQVMLNTIVHCWLNFFKRSVSSSVQITK
ncbi:hypothetical protein BpHYR1_036406 [Brachionus plicatilis]|uniref:Uncharacterized protein n=1 Tax=Brachionus plicatilis TaxID=10195 RepID=A0A3M7T1W2_BRAPC|nr:hypothetical protein BpHYR1_036406 [Brachionus plicatilis]